MPWDSARLGMRCSLSIKVFLKLTRWFLNVSKYENHSLREAILKGEQGFQNCNSSIFWEFVRNVKYQASLHIYWIKTLGVWPSNLLSKPSRYFWYSLEVEYYCSRSTKVFLQIPGSPNSLLQSESASQESLKIVCIWKSLLRVLWKRHSAHQLDKDLTV